MDEQERDQEAPDPSVAVEVRVDALELGVGETGEDQKRWRGLGVEELLECVESLLHLGNRWRDERRLFQGGTFRSNPVLGAAELAGCRTLAAAAPQQFGVDLTDQSKRERKLMQPGKAVVHGSDVGDDFSDVASILCLWLELALKECPKNV